MTRAVWMVVGIVALAAVAILAGQLVPRPEPPLTGAMSVDLGVHEFRSPETRLSHQFVLTNTSRRTIRIVDHNSTCGCATAALSRTTIAPGESLTVSVEVSYIQPGRRREYVRLFPEQGNTIELAVEGVARRRQHYRITQTAILPTPGQSATVILIATTHDTDETPVVPAIEAPEGVGVERSEWKLAFKRDPEKGRPARWQSIVRVSVASGVMLDRGTKMRFAFAPDDVVEVDLTGRAWK